MGTLHRSMRPAGTLKKSSGRLRRDSISAVKAAESVRMTSRLERCACGHVGRDTDGLDRQRRFGLGIEAHGCAAARQRGEQFHAFHHAPHERHVAVQVPRSMADHHVHFRAAAAANIQVAAHAHHAVAMRQPGAVQRRGAGNRQAVRETDFGRVHIAVGQARERHARGDGGVEFRRDLADAGRHRMAIVGVAPLRHVIVLHADDGQGIEIPRPGQGFDVGHVQRREAGRQFDDHPAAGQFDVQGVVRVERPPIRRAGGGQNLRHGGVRSRRARDRAGLRGGGLCRARRAAGVWPTKRPAQPRLKT